MLRMASLPHTLIAVTSTPYGLLRRGSLPVSTPGLAKGESGDGKACLPVGSYRHGTSVVHPPTRPEGRRGGGERTPAAMRTLLA